MLFQRLTYPSINPVVAARKNVKNIIFIVVLVIGGMYSFLQCFLYILYKYTN